MDTPCGWNSVCRSNPFRVSRNIAEDEAYTHTRTHIYTFSAGYTHTTHTHNTQKIHTHTHTHNTHKHTHKHTHTQTHTHTSTHTLRSYANKPPFFAVHSVLFEGMRSSLLKNAIPSKICMSSTPVCVVCVCVCVCMCVRVRAVV